MSAKTDRLKPGDRIWYAQAWPGGYGFDHDVPGEFVKYCAKRVRVCLLRRPGTPVIVSVHPRNVRRRHVRLEKDPAHES